MTHFEVTTSTNYDIIKTLFVEYSKIKGAEGCFVSFEKELADLATFYKGGAILVGSEDGTPVATIALKKVDETIAEVKRLFIKPEHRGKGYSRKMLDAMFQCAKTLGYKEVMLTTRPEVMPVAYALYQRIGFYQTDFNDGVATMRMAIAK
ncbi:MAG: GNAT family N-acetyltransferase [Bacteroidales bacterium]|jgi:carbonic anhydrase|nr:GNAT family N-acetyltransferase [Bacteroidales bacterium]